MKAHRRAGRLLRAMWTEARAERLTFVAGTIAYHAFVSLLPFMLVLLLLVAAVDDQATALDVITAMGSYLTPNADGLLTRTVREASERTSLSLLGVAVLLWGAVKIFRSLDEAFSGIYDVERSKSLADSVTDAVIALVAVTAALVVAAAVGSVLAFAEGPVGSTLETVVSTASLAAVFLPLYYLFPDEDVTVREVLPGTALAAVGWTLVEFLFRYYVAVASVGERYGVVGTILLVLTWLYVSGLVLLLGAALNAVLGGRSADVAELGWGENREAKARAPFVEPLATLDEAFAAGREVTVRVGDDEVTLSPPDEFDCDVSAPDRPDVLGGEEVEGRLRLRWVHGRSVGESET